jgi:hypothetical protein
VSYKYELFISYASEDRPWAERLYQDVKARDAKLACFWDRDSLKTGGEWQTQLEQDLADSRHFVVLWSNHAEKDGSWVGPEIERFNVLKSTAKTERTLFYVPLQGKRGTLERLQGLPDIREGDFYKEGAGAAAPGGKAAAAWSRIVTRIVSGVDDARQDGTPIHVGLLVATDAQFEDVSPTSKVAGKKLADYLDKLGLDFAQVKARYQPRARDWAPFDQGPSLEVLLDQVKIAVNTRFANLNTPAIRWKWLDLTEPIALTGNERSDKARGLAATLATGPSLLVIDPLSLYNRDIEDVYDALGACFQTDKVAVFCPSPKGLPETDAITEDLVKLVGKGHFVKFFDPLPPIPAYPFCGFNLTHQAQLSRFVAGTLGARLLATSQGNSFTVHPDGTGR